VVVDVEGGRCWLDVESGRWLLTGGKIFLTLRLDLRLRLSLIRVPAIAIAIRPVLKNVRHLCKLSW